MTVAATTGIPARHIHTPEAEEVVEAAPHPQKAALRECFGLLVLAIRHSDGNLEFSLLPEHKKELEKVAGA